MTKLQIPCGGESCIGGRAQQEILGAHNILFTWVVATRGEFILFVTLHFVYCVLFLYMRYMSQFKISLKGQADM